MIYFSPSFATEFPERVFVADAQEVKRVRAAHEGEGLGRLRCLGVRWASQEHDGLVTVSVSREPGPGVMPGKIVELGWQLRMGPLREPFAGLTAILVPAGGALVIEVMCQLPDAWGIEVGISAERIRLERGSE